MLGDLTHQPQQQTGKAQPHRHELPEASPERRHRLDRQPYPYVTQHRKEYPALKIYLYYCSNNLKIEELRQYCGELKTISLPCSGKLDLLYLVKAFETGAHGVVIVTCTFGECRHLEGNLRAQKRAESVDALLEEIGMGTGRIRIIQSQEGNTEQVIDAVKDFSARIGELLAPQTPWSNTHSAHEVHSTTVTDRDQHNASGK
jgi:coenzyme F420-reducing hydrogenase delta subunit